MAIVIFGGPFSGKSTLSAILAANGVVAFDSDVIRSVAANELGYDMKRDNLWEAWAADHPNHATWEKVNDLEQATEHAILECNGILITHDPKFKWEFPRPVPHIMLSLPISEAADMKERIASHLRKYFHPEGEKFNVWQEDPDQALLRAASRLAAMIHWHNKAMEKGWYKTSDVRTIPQILKTLGIPQPDRWYTTDETDRLAWSNADLVRGIVHDVAQSGVTKPERKEKSEVCSICGFDHHTPGANEWHIHNWDQVVCEKHFEGSPTDEELTAIRNADIKESGHPEWFPEGRRNIGITGYLRGRARLRQRGGL